MAPILRACSIPVRLVVGSRFLTPCAAQVMSWNKNFSQRHDAFFATRAAAGALAICLRNRGLSFAGGLPASPAVVIRPTCRALQRGRIGGSPAMMVSRSFFTRFAQQRQLQALERDAQQYPRDAAKQAEFLKKLNSHDPEAVLRRVESQQYAMNHDGLIEYIKALVLQGKFDRNDLAHINRLAEANNLHDFKLSSIPDRFPIAPAGGSPVMSMQMALAGAGGRGSGGGAGGAGAGRGGGSAKEPLRVSLAEPSFQQQVWKTVRTLAVAYLLLLGMTTMMEERGLSRGSAGKTEATQAAESTKTFKDVVGVDEAKSELMEIVDFLRNPDKFTRLGGKMTKGVLLMGPPGTGKTLLAKAIAGEAGVPFFYASGSEFEEMYVGVGARRVRDLFDSAKRKSPCIIFIDEIDAIGATRNPKDQQYMRMTLNQLLAEMDGFTSSEGIVVIAATNFPEVLDKALTRPGRFDRHVVVPNPDVKGRTQILNLHLGSVPVDEGVKVSVVARGTPGFSGADLANLVNIAAIKASQDNKDRVDMADLEFAKDRIMMGAERKSAVITEESRRLTAYHEGGHAIVACFTDGALPVHKATVVPRGMALGMVTQLPDNDETSWSRRQMLAKMDVCMGGRVAEEIIFGAEHVTSGASSDFDQATQIAINMVERWGMSEKLGFVAHKHLTGNGRNGSEAAYSEETRKLIDTEVKRLTDEAYANAKKILKKHEDKLHLLAKKLIEHETLTGEEIRRTLGLAEPVDKNSEPKSLDDRKAAAVAGKTSKAPL